MLQKFFRGLSCSSAHQLCGITVKFQGKYEDNKRHRKLLKLLYRLFMPLRCTVAFSLTIHIIS